MGQRAWVPSPCPLSRPCPFLLLLLLLVVVPRGAQPQVGRVSTDLSLTVWPRAPYGHSGFLGRGLREERAPQKG